MTKSKIIWTKIDEAPALATHTLLPIIQAYTKNSGIEVETKDISLLVESLQTFLTTLLKNKKFPII